MTEIRVLCPSCMSSSIVDDPSEARQIIEQHNDRRHDREIASMFRCGDLDSIRSFLREMHRVIDDTSLDQIHDSISNDPEWIDVDYSLFPEQYRRSYGTHHIFFDASFNSRMTSIGGLLEDSREQTILTMSREIDDQISTSNEAEMVSLREILRETKEFGIGRIFIRGDHLMTKEILSNDLVVRGNLGPIIEEIRSLLSSFRHWEIDHIPREKNRRSHRLAREVRS